MLWKRPPDVTKTSILRVSDLKVTWTPVRTPVHDLSRTCTWRPYNVINTSSRSFEVRLRFCCRPSFLCLCVTRHWSLFGFIEVFKNLSTLPYVWLNSKHAKGPYIKDAKMGRWKYIFHRQCKYWKSYICHSINQYKLKFWRGTLRKKK